MKKRRMLLVILCFLVGGGMASTAHAVTTYFDVTDEAGWWFDTGTKIGGTRSLAVVKRGTKIKFLQKSSKFGPARSMVPLVWRVGIP